VNGFDLHWGATDSGICKMHSFCYINNYFFVVKELVEINGTTFYIDVNENGFSREEAMALCDTQNMTLLSFENATEKWENVNGWLEINGMCFL
jgi:hypothetical protein